MDSEEQISRRNRRTICLLWAGAASLLVPLLGLLYIRMTDTPAVKSGNIPHPFAHRDTPADRIKVAAAPAPQAPMGPAGAVVPKAPASPAAPMSDSLGFIKGGSEYYPDERTPQAAAAKAEQNPQAATAKAEPPPRENTASPNQRKPSKSRTKTFVQPKLQASKFGGSFGSGADKSKAGPPGGMPDVSGLLKNMPGAGGAGAAGTPDIGSMLQGVTGADKKK